MVAADGLAKRDVFRLPDPFAVITVDAEQTHTTSVIKKTLNPYWNENFDVYVSSLFTLDNFFAVFKSRFSALSRIALLSQSRFLTRESSNEGTKVSWAL